MSRFRRRIQLKTSDQILAMRRAGIVVAGALDTVRAAVEPGITTGELDAIAETYIRDHGATPSFLGYQGYPASLCISVDDEVVHGIPGDRELRDGDLVSIDCGAIVDGWHGDSAITVGVGQLTPEFAELSRVCEESMWRGIAAVSAGGRLSDVGHAVESYVRSAGDYGVLEDYVGHGIGTEMHQDPQVPNYGQPGHGPELVVGLAIAIEPMITMGQPETHMLSDDWTVVTDDGSWAAHWEHSVALTAHGVWVLTAADGGRERLGDLGVAFGGLAERA
jgi:methionyl aminopeptidase